MEKNALKITEQDILLRIFVGERQKLNGKPLYEALIIEARKLGLAGATVSRGIMGYGADRRMHTSKILELSENLPVIIEIIDREENISRLLPFMDANVTDGFITMEKVNVIRYRSSAG